MSTLVSVQHYDGKVLASTKDLQTSAGCTAEAMPAHLRSLLADIHEEVRDRCYGCGSPIPSELEGCTVLDLDSGSGRHHHFGTGRPHRVRSNTAAVLGSTRDARHFEIAGDTSTHYGLFDCAPTATNVPASGAWC